VADPSYSTRFDRRKQRTRQQIMDAAAALILEYGFDAVSIQEITDGADLGRGTFYLHFRDKEEVVARIIQGSFEAFEAQGAALDGLTFEQREYLSYIGFFMHIAAQSPIFNAVGGSNGAAVVASYIGEYVLIRAQMRLREQAAMQTMYPDVEPDVAAQFMTGALMQMVSWWLKNTDRYTPQQVAGMFYRLLHHKPPPSLAAAP
jgi:AcrR family transcriptional regulator